MGEMTGEELVALLTTPHVDKEIGEVVPLPDLKVSVRVRGLSRKEVLTMRLLKDKGVLNTEDKWEAHMLSKGLLEPRMSEEQVLAWQAASPAGEMNPVADKVTELSGMNDRPDKQAMSTFPGEPGE